MAEAFPGFDEFLDRLPPIDPIMNFLASGGHSSEFEGMEIPKYLRRSEILNLKGPLKAARFLSEDWEKWCKEGVVCFSMGVMDLEKVYFANPRDLSIYHVADFVIGEQYGSRRFPETHSVACVLFGSKIYMIGGRGIGRGDPTDIYYCDVATQTQLPGGGYEWMPGPDLNSGKRTPNVFSLAGNIYVLSVDNPSTPFEVMKSNSDRWEVLTNPPYPLWSGDPSHYIRVKRSCTVDGKKIVIQFEIVDTYLFMYDAEVDKWTRMALPALLFDDTCYCLHVEGEGFLLDEGQGLYLSLDFESLCFKAFDEAEDFYFPCQCHLLHLSGKKFCAIALFALSDDDPCYAEFATFDLDISTPPYSVSNLKKKKVILHDDPVLGPYEFCSKIGAFPFC